MLNAFQTFLNNQRAYWNPIPNPDIIPGTDSTTRELMLSAKARIRELDETHPLVYGPLEMTEETKQLEMIGKALMGPIPLRAQVKAFDEPDGTIRICIEGRNYNLNQLIARANLHHIQFSDEDLNNIASEYPNWTAPNHIHKVYYYVVYKYTQSSATTSMILNNRAHVDTFYSRWFNKNDFLPALRNALILLSYLNTPDNDPNPNFVLRGESVFSDTVQSTRVQGSQHGLITRSSQCLSTTISASPFMRNSYICLTGLRGKYIEKLSFYPREKEFLVPPGQIRWLKSVTTGRFFKTHYFLGQIVDTPEPQGLPQIADIPQVEALPPVQEPVVQAPPVELPPIVILKRPHDDNEEVQDEDNDAAVQVAKKAKTGPST